MENIYNKNSNKTMIDEFNIRIEEEARYKKFLELELIEKILNKFQGNYSRKEYDHKINNCLELALDFYKDYNYKFYQMIVNGIENKTIVFDDKILKSYVDTTNNKAYIKLNKDDGDLYILVHEFAHYIDRNFTPKIIPDNFSFLSETFSLFMEKQLEQWLKEDKYNDLISARRNNRVYFESKMTKAIEYELYYEKLYTQNGTIPKEEMNIEKIRYIMKYDYPNLVNYLIQYPLANVLSDYLIKIKFNPENEDICEKCFQSNLYELLQEWPININNAENTDKLNYQKKYSITNNG